MRQSVNLTTRKYHPQHWPTGSQWKDGAFRGRFRSNHVSFSARNYPNIRANDRRQKISTAKKEKKKNNKEENQKNNNSGLSHLTDTLWSDPECGLNWRFSFHLFRHLGNVGNEWHLLGLFMSTMDQCRANAAHTDALDYRHFRL